MSETDDTEILLLIPPDFFLVPSSGSDDSLVESSRTVVHKPCTAQVLNKLVSQVQSLNTRLDNLEFNTSDTSSLKENQLLKYQTWDYSGSFDSRSLDRKCYTFPRRRRRRKVSALRKKRDLSLVSFDSSSLCSKDIPSLLLNDNIKKIECTSNIPSEVLSMDGDISSIVSSPNKKNDKLLLHEIDDFLNKVESYESPDTKLKASQRSFSPNNLIQATGDYINQRLDNRNSLTNDETKLNAKLEPTISILDKYIYLTKTSSTPQEGKTSDVKASTSIEGASTCVKNIPKTTAETTITPSDLKMSIARKLNYLDPRKDIQPTSTPKQIPTTSYADTFRPSSNKIYNRASKILDQYQLNCNRHSDYSLETSYLQSPKRNALKMSNKSNVERRPLESRSNFILNRYAESIDTDLLSLSELWGDKGEKVDNGRLEEERLKREHCEAMIQDLQRKVLEQQEKLAVALKVDRAKDSAITRLRDAWLKITGSLDKAEARHKASLDKMNSEVDNFKHMLDEAHKKQQHFETELYKALDLAHDYQDKYKSLSEEKNQLQESIEQLLVEKSEIIKNKDVEIENLKENCEAFMRLNKQSSDCIKNLEETIEKEKSEHSITKNKLSDANKKIQAGLDQMSLLNQEWDLFKDKINEERARSGVLEKQLSEKLVHLSEAQKRE
ncbi:hypothetical protein EVAR_83973_1 [Eumeta japonica]|uniref:Uncharacterized protein n=1 Tax=Eumeta variegata TaxID=151549 RepID=A0A4C1VNL3_EUMVA|nr:hypothetical protein EVAR_83973_1 [Eumeta japonica]